MFEQGGRRQRETGRGIIREGKTELEGTLESKREGGREGTREKR